MKFRCRRYSPDGRSSRATLYEALVPTRVVVGTEAVDRRAFHTTPKPRIGVCTVDDTSWMRRALRLAEAGRGSVAPNPLVGAVLVRDGVVVGEGAHTQPGGPHAEAVALSIAGARAREATLYSTVEPCCWEGPGKRTPPCAQRVVAAGVRRVVIATADPHPRVAGAGIRLLRDAGLEVEVGLLRHQARLQNEVHFKATRTGLPFVHLKIAQSLDGRIATATGHSKWITDAAARAIVHRQRAGYDAILVGATTVQRDDPALTPRLTDFARVSGAEGSGAAAGQRPRRVVLDSHLRAPLQARLFQDEDRRRTIVLTTADHPPERRRLLEAAGVTVRPVAATTDGRVDLPRSLAALLEMGISSLYVEGGGEIFTAFVSQQLFDRLSVFIAPIILGDGIPAIGPMGISRVQNAVQLETVSITEVNDQVLVEGYRDLEGLLGEPATVENVVKAG